jgi:SAM-dependent methyltransferase
MMNDEPTASDKAEPVSMAGAGTHEAVLDLIARYLPRPARVVDLAAGQGAFSLELKRLGHSVTAVDLDGENWKAPEIPLALADLDAEFASSVSPTGERYDAIAAIEIIEHLENPFRFVRECSKLLRPGGLMFLTSPNVEAISSRLMFLYTGRLGGFGAYETVRPAHITPIFKWKLDMILDEAGFETVHESFNHFLPAGNGRLKLKIATLAGKLLAPIVKGEKGSEGRIVVARLNR